MSQPSAPSDAELSVLKCFWRDGDLSAREVQDRIGAEQGWTSSTTRTVLERMVAKGLLIRRSVHGLAVYEAQCALCHGANGEGTRSGDHQVFPPLWGAQSYNWGAGMSNISNAAAFIQANMPLSKGGSLSEQDAWDVAQYIDSQDRPQDPRFTRDVATTRQEFHDTDDSMYGKTVNGKVLGRNSK